jgi:MSHA biogenesis protein MshI
LNLFGRTKRATQSGHIGLSFSDEGLAMVWIDPKADRPLRHWELLVDSPSQLAGRLAERVTSLELNDLPCFAVMGAQDYSLQLVEAPDVPESDLAAAVKFQIRDSINMSLADAEVQVFAVPESAYRQQGRMLYAAATHRARVMEIRDCVLNAGLVLKAIDVRESVMRDLASQMASDENGLACLDVREGQARLLLIKSGDIYLCRQLNTQIDQSQMASQDWANTFQRFLVELQRSFDYFENQMGQGQILRLLLAPVPGVTNQLIEQLNLNLMAEGSVMDLNQLWNTGSILSAREQHDCLFASGAALARVAA